MTTSDHAAAFRAVAVAGGVSPFADDLLCMNVLHGNMKFKCQQCVQIRQAVPEEAASARNTTPAPCGAGGVSGGWR
jgi:hypothetical protein